MSSSLDIHIHIYIEATLCPISQATHLIPQPRHHPLHLFILCLIYRLPCSRYPRTRHRRRSRGPVLAMSLAPRPGVGAEPHGSRAPCRRKVVDLYCWECARGRNILFAVSSVQVEAYCGEEKRRYGDAQVDEFGDVFGRRGVVLMRVVPWMSIVKGQSRSVWCCC